jgi:Tol biopolymer transport system component
MAFSPDGRQFAYLTREGLYLRKMDTLEARLIPGTKGLLKPFFSPDGESVAYFQDNELRRVSVSGGAPVVICAAKFSSGEGESWGPENVILFVQPEGIMRVSANGGTPELVIKANTGEVIHGPQLLPEGDSVLFSGSSRSRLTATRWCV